MMENQLGIQRAWSTECWGLIERQNSEVYLGTLYKEFETMISVRTSLISHYVIQTPGCFFERRISFKCYLAVYT